MSTKVVVVMCHSSTEEACRRHYPYWRAMGEVLFFCPGDSVVELPDLKPTVVSFGRAGHHTRGANDRFLRMLCVCAGTMADSFLINEYDSVCFDPNIQVPDDQLGAIAFSDIRLSRGFIGSRFLHPPLFFNRATLTTLIATLETQQENEGFFWDRWLGLATQRANIPIFDLNEQKLGYSQNTIGAEHLAEAIGAIKGGAVCFHGVKTRAVFDALKFAGRW